MEQSAASLGVNPDSWKPIAFLNNAHYAQLTAANMLEDTLDASERPVTVPISRDEPCTSPSSSLLELAIEGSGVYRMDITNSNLWTSVACCAHVALEPSTKRRRDGLERALAKTRSELERVVSREEELGKSEVALSHRLWEVQETRRRESALAEQLRGAVRVTEEALGQI